MEEKLAYCSSVLVNNSPLLDLLLLQGHSFLVESLFPCYYPPPKAVNVF